MANMKTKQLSLISKKEPLYKIKRIKPFFPSLLESVEVVSDGSWTEPPDWTGPSPAFYQSFDSLDGMVLKEGNGPGNFDPFASGRVRIIYIIIIVRYQVYQQSL